jgi:putative protein-disulfide isomerase
MTAPPDQKHLVYFADPMCSWCYGFSPLIAALEQQFRERLPLRLVMGGLRTGNTRPMQPDDKDYLRDAWTRVTAATGQPFDFAFLAREGFVYDTEPACRAVVTLRGLDPPCALAYMGAVQRAFYAENRDVTSATVLADLAAEEGHDCAAFESAFASPEVRNETFRDFLTTQEFGIHGFPTVIAGNDTGGYALVTSGYRPLDGLPEAIETWLAASAPICARGEAAAKSAP